MGPLGEPLVAGGSRLIGLIEVDGSVHVLTLDSEGGLAVAKVLFSSVPQVPEPIDFLWGRLEMLASDSSLRRFSGKPLLLAHAGTSAVAWQEGRGLDARVMLAVRGADGRHAVAWSAERSELVAAWSADGRVNLLLAESGGAGHREFAWASLPAPPFPIDVTMRRLAVIPTEDAMASFRLAGAASTERLGFDVIAQWSPEPAVLEGVAIGSADEPRFARVERDHGNANIRALEVELLRQLR